MFPTHRRAIVTKVLAAALVFAACPSWAGWPPTFEAPEVVTPVQKQSLASRMSREHGERMARAIALAKSKGLPVEGQYANGAGFALVDFDNGQPVYQSDELWDTAIAHGYNKVNNVAPFKTSGNGVDLGVFEGGKPRASHVEFAGQKLFVEDFGLGVSKHATLVTGIIISKGANPNALGLAPGSGVSTYGISNDVVRMATIGAPGPLYGLNTITASNHSYGTESGWDFITNPVDAPANTYPIWYGVWGDPEDYKFGKYGQKPRGFDEVCYNLPYYLPVKSAGNDRNNDVFPDAKFYYYLDGTLTSGTYTSSYPPADYEPDGGYDTLTQPGSAKNILTVGCVKNVIVSGALDATKMEPTDFSSYGPTDDLRIKPDLVTDGGMSSVPGAASDIAYSGATGTSMAAPVVTAGIAVVVEYFRKTFPGADMRASTIKALLIHTAFDEGTIAGNVPNRPDCKTGYGLLNVHGAIRLIQLFANDLASAMMREDSLSSGNAVDEFIYYIGTGKAELKVTLAWTDPPGVVDLTSGENEDSRLVNDLDLRLIEMTDDQNYFPFRVGPGLSFPVGLGDNDRDNVEQVYYSQTGVITKSGYVKVRVSHKGTLTNGIQRYSLIVTGQHVNGANINPLLLGASNLKLKTKSGSGSSDPKKTFTMSNPSGAAKQYAFSPPGSWVTVQPPTLRLEPGETKEVVVKLNADALRQAPGAFPGSVLITDSDSGTTTSFDADFDSLTATVPFFEGFDPEPTGAPRKLSPVWTIGGAGEPDTRLTTDTGFFAGGGYLVLADALTTYTSYDETEFTTGSTEIGTFFDSAPSRNELTLAVDLAGYSNAVLSFAAKSLGDSPDGPPSSPFVDGADFDGVAMSVDGTTWYEIQSLRSLSVAAYTPFSVDLNAAANLHGLTLARPTYIRFNQFGNKSWNHFAPDESGGIAIDSVSITGEQRAYASSAPGSWNHPGTWVPSGVPGPGNPVTISHAVTLTTSSQAASVRVVPGGTLSLGSNTLTIDDEGWLDVDSAGGSFVPGTGLVVFDGNTTNTPSVAFHNVRATGEVSVGPDRLSGGLELAGLGRTDIANDTTIPATLAVRDVAEVEQSSGAVLRIGGDLDVDADALAMLGGSVRFIGSGTSQLDLESDVVFGDLLVESGKMLASNNNRAQVSGTLTNLGVIRNTQGVVTTGPLVFGLTGASMDFASTGTLSQIVVDRVDQNHPNATAAQQTGRFWSITPTGGGYIAALTLPHNSPAVHPTLQLSRHTGGGTWEGGRTSSTPETVTRAGITAFSDWVVSFPPATVVDWSMY